MPGSVLYNMVISLQINKITFDQSETLEKKSDFFNRKLLFFLKVLFMVFLKLPWRRQYLKILKIKPGLSNIIKP